MTAARKKVKADNNLPRARLTPLRWNFPLVWVIPVIAALVAGYLVYGRVQDYGPRVTIKFKDGNGLRAGKTGIQYRGVRIGEVTALGLSEDMQHVLVEARLQRSAASIAREGSAFWVVRLGGEIENISNLGTVITGAYIAVAPGTGEVKSDFVGLENSQVASEPGGLRLVLHSDRLGSVKPNSPVYYRGVEVGAVQACHLGANATAVEILVHIKPRYAKLVRSNTKFWNVGGTDVKFGLFSGLEVNVQSLKSLVSGGIAFATPSDPRAAPARDGMVFRLFEEGQKEWLEWAPQIAIPPG
jgi:paraquat-inducible protein B